MENTTKLNCSNTFLCRNGRFFWIILYLIFLFFPSTYIFKVCCKFKNSPQFYWVIIQLKEKLGHMICHHALKNLKIPNGSQLNLIAVIMNRHSQNQTKIQSPVSTCQTIHALLTRVRITFLPGPTPPLPSPPLSALSAVRRQRTQILLPRVPFVSRRHAEAPKS